MKLCMIGTGYVGLVSGVCFSDLGNDVICVDRDKEKIDSLKNLKYGQSVTDACVSWKDTEVMLKLLAKAVDARREKLKRSA